MPNQKSRRHHSQTGQEKDQNRQFEKNSDPEHDVDEALKIDVHRNHRNHKVPFGNTQQKCEPISENDKISEHASRNKQARGTDQQRPDPAPFVPVQARRNKGPELVENPGRGQKNRPHDGQLHPDDLKPIHRIENIELWRVAERLQCLRSRPANETPERICERKREDVRKRQASQRPE